MNHLIFRGAYFRHCVIQDEESGVFVRANMTADLSEPVCEEMGWDIGEGQSGGDLKGRLEGTAVILTPNDSNLKREMQAVCSHVTDFEWVEVKDKKSQATHRELRFIVRFPAEVAPFIVDYKQRVGREPSQMKLSYNAPSQEELPLDDRQGTLMEDANCVDCANEIPFMEGSTDTHASGQKCAAKEAGPTLASATTVGGTHQKRRGGQIPDPAVQ